MLDSLDAPWSNQKKGRVATASRDVLILTFTDQNLLEILTQNYKNVHEKLEYLWATSYYIGFENHNLGSFGFVFTP